MATHFRTLAWRTPMDRGAWQAEIFKILKDDTVLALHSMLANFENSEVATRLQNVSFHLIPKKGNATECSNYHTTVLNSHTSKVTLKILQARLQQYMNQELSDYKLDL